MSQKIRKSIAEDVQEFLVIKAQLSLSLVYEKNTGGGFLLGTDIDTYLYYIQNGHCLTAIVNDKIVGFGIVLPDTLIKKSELWQKRTEVNWTIAISDLENSHITYFEQLAFLKGYSRLSLLLAYNLLKLAFDSGAEMMLTTTVKKPVVNLAAVPYIKSIGGEIIGNIDEFYPKVGKINSDVYRIHQSDFKEKIQEFSLYNYLKKNTLR